MKQEIINSINICNIIYKQFSYLLDSYVSDFYVDSHWSKLLDSWKIYFKEAKIKDLSRLLDFSKSLDNQVYPLSLLCLRNLIIKNIISRKQIEIDIENVNILSPDKNFMKFFWKNVKEKKRHEINVMSKICYKSALQTGCFYIVDIGSGMGHLSRMLSYGYGFKVCTFEANKKLADLAKSLDEQFKQRLEAKGIFHRSKLDTIHISKRIEIDMCKDEFINILQKAFCIDNRTFYFGIVGLHPCGDLGATLLRLYKECENALFINIVSCCYMKLSPRLGFPLSNHCKINKYKLSYLSCEIACHAIENYVEKLQLQIHSPLKIHAYRAALEKLLISLKPELRHCQICSVKYHETLTFEEYCKKALNKYNINLPHNYVMELEDVIKCTWHNVVIFYSLRLMLAPLTETIILFDRMLYMEENGSTCEILPVFNSKLSPRNHVLNAIKCL